MILIVSRMSLFFLLGVLFFSSTHTVFAESLVGSVTVREAPSSTATTPPVSSASSGGGAVPAAPFFWPTNPPLLPATVSEPTQSRSVDSLPLPSKDAQIEVIASPPPPQITHASSSKAGLVDKFTDVGFFEGAAYPRECAVGLGSSSLNALKQKIILLSRSQRLRIAKNQVTIYAEFVKYGSSLSTCTLGEGERFAMVRDAMEVLKRADFPYKHIEGMADQSIALTKSLIPENQRVYAAKKEIADLEKKLNRPFSEHERTLATQFIMHRYRRVPRRLGAERAAIQTFIRAYKRVPKTTVDWAKIRIITYVIGSTPVSK